METYIPHEVASSKKNQNKSQLTNQDCDLSTLIRGDQAMGKICHCSASTIKRGRENGEIPYMQLGKVILFDLPTVLAAISKSKTVAP